MDHTRLGNTGLTVSRACPGFGDPAWLDGVSSGTSIITGADQLAEAAEAMQLWLTPGSRAELEKPRQRWIMRGLE